MSHICEKVHRNDKIRHVGIERAEKFISTDYWTDVNLTSILYRPGRLPVSLSVYSVPETDVNATDRVSVAQVLALEKDRFREAKIGEKFGPSWATHWFKVAVSIPLEWAGEEVHLLWSNGSEALVYDSDGIPRQSLYGSKGDDARKEFILTRKAEKQQQITLYIEMACNGMFGNPKSGFFLNPPDPDLKFELSQAEIARPNRKAMQLYYDMEILIALAKELDADSNRAWQASGALDRIMNALWIVDAESLDAALAISQEFLAKQSGDSEHVIWPIGHCHIDTAWLWTYSETRRKCARSWSNQITLMQEYPEYHFTASQAQQFEWTKENYPKLYQQMKDQPRFVPTGGTWVEMDCNVPSGESLVRQFLYGQRYFESEFGKRCTEFWLPDTFGYNSQLPQIIRGAGMDKFVTQKISWNLINIFPQTTFFWQGLDGSKVLCHFPPANNYCSKANVGDLLLTLKNNKNKDTSNHSMLLFGFGDGGGGPSRMILERLKRSDTDGLPKLKYATPECYFKTIEQEKSHPTWVGELYLELHQGTYTTHAKVKRANRKCEFLLGEVELYSALAHLAGRSGDQPFEYPRKELDRLWKLLLLNQFHDVIPGTSIGPVYTDTAMHHADILETGSRILKSALARLASGSSHSIHNPLGWARTGVVQLQDRLALVRSPAGGLSRVEEVTEFVPVSLTKLENGAFQLENRFMVAVVDSTGGLTRLFHKETNHESIAPNAVANKFLLMEDLPFFWDAWDVMLYAQYKYKYCPCEARVEVTVDSPLRCTLKFTSALSELSSIALDITLDCDSETLEFGATVDWHESRKFLKVEFPFNVHSDVAHYSIQFGNTQRATHTNTSWDAAKYEVCGHHYADLSEYGFGVALLNDSKYGYACANGHVMRLSLLRSPKQPDGEADMGQQVFRYGIRPHKGCFKQANVVRSGYEFNQPLQLIPGTAEHHYSFLSLDENIKVESVKLAEREEAAIVVRVWETMGGRGLGSVRLNLPTAVTAVKRCNLLEDEVASETLSWTDNTLSFSYTPYAILTFKLYYK